MSSNGFQSLLGAAQSLTGRSKDKLLPRSTYASLPAQGVPLSDPYQSQGAPKAGPGQLRFSKFRRWGRIAATVSNVLSSLFSIFMEVVMIYVTYKYYNTRDIRTPTQTWGPWAKNTVLWPTFMLAVASASTILSSIGQLIGLCCRAKRGGRFFSVLYTVIHVIFWIAVSALYRIFKTDDDLWGWSCLDKAKAIQDELGSDVLNFGFLCKIQVCYPH